jgi:hypothetical protein
MEEKRILKGYQCFDVLEKLRLVSDAVEQAGDDDIELAWWDIRDIVINADIREFNSG